MMDDILFKQEHRESLIKLTTKKVKIDRRQQTVANAIYIYLENILRILETDYTDYKEEFIFPLPYCYDI